MAIIIDIDDPYSDRAKQFRSAVARHPAHSGSADPIGDDQAERSGWGGLDECGAVEGGTPINNLTITGPYRRPSTWRRFLRWLATT